MATGVQVRPQPFPVGATPQVSVTRSASQAHLIMSSGVWDVHGADTTDQNPANVGETLVLD